MHSERGRARRLLLSASILALSAGVPATLLASSGSAAGVQQQSSTTVTETTTTVAAVERPASKANKAKAKASGADLLRKTQKSLSVVATTTKRLTRADRAKAAPFVQAIGLTDRQMKALKDAIARKDKKALGKAVSDASRVVGKLNATYKMARVADKKVAEGMRAFNASWNQTLKRLGGGKAKVTADSTRANARRINAVRKRVDTTRSRSQRREDIDALTLIIAMLDEALLLNRSADYQWMALARIDEAYGYYGGYYDYVVIYEPQYAVTIQDDYYYWNNVADVYVTEYDSYYEEYSFESYETVETYEYTESVEVSEEVVSQEVITASEETIDTVESEAIATGAETDGYDEAVAIEAEVEAAAEADEQAEPLADPATAEDPEVDAAADQPLSEDEAEQVVDEDEGLYDEAPEAGESEAAPDEEQAEPDTSPEEELQPEEPAPEAEPDVEPEPEAIPEEEAQPEPEPEPEPEAVPEEDYQPEAEPEPEPEPEPMMEEEPAPEPEPESFDDGG